MVALISGSLISPANAQFVEPEGQANYAFAIFTGTGRYSLDDRTIYVLRGSFTRSGRDSSFETDAGAVRQWGYKFLLPVALGVTNFSGLDDLPGLELDNLQTLSFVPGMEFEYPITENWLLRPFAQAGFGYEFDDGDTTFVWGAGLRTRAWLDRDSRWMIGGEFLWAGNNPSDSNLASSTFNRISVGLDYRIPTQQRIFDREIAWHLRGILRKYGKDLDFEAPPEFSDIDRSREISISAELSSPIDILGFKIFEGGIGYERADGFDAVKLVGGFPF